MIALMGGVMLQAEVLKVENFEYEIGTVIESTANWETPYSGASGVTVTNALGFEGYASDTVGGALALDVEVPSGYHPHLAFKQVTEGCVYSAFLLYAYENYKTGWFMSYREEPASDTKNFSYIGRVSLDDANQLGLRYFKTAPAEYNTDEMLSPTQVYLCVLKYEIKPGANNDEVSIYVFDKMPKTMPEKPFIGPIKDAGAPDIKPSQLVVTSYDSDGHLSIGAIRIATTMEEALGIEAFEPEPEPEPEPEGIQDVRNERQEIRKTIEEGRLVIEVNGKRYGVGGEL